MRTDKFGQQILDESDICNFYLTNPDNHLKSCLVEGNIPLINELDLSNFPKITPFVDSDLSVPDWDNTQQQKWLMPEEYKSFDIALYVLNKCNTEAELQRAGEELFLFHERGLFPLLQYLKYLVDTMKANDIVWGVGRGSSVASYVLFLLEVHRINSLYYDLSIDEFLK